ncbi:MULTISPECIES: hypothetical protein [Methylobacterium]|uniref:DUF4178 domain-containing protein n=2 Tax=Pseudomonadota TaxID=1224 RepID=A0ABQ4T1D7_9HYPH|nr:MULTISPECIES: hypothetical protein [Methylobacterium]PIU06889.1 MAG: hypothetical protein COT56_07080 [Methylobacterium sp. CG09_land_8_20_14_0_10_71_15]PIU16101.1 MAG: hypothetical protein COT28_01400 [Methylobacterium sp. CG08_land_8_20_14_0_20_71_15]GBU19366.1 hypothetical protein AwMethylo_35810 [Methylobacterium sp.]GJE08605.1 hypothetical protein AOPFMNJM_3948 [Methylobacterium jeotgali]
MSILHRPEVPDPEIEASSLMFARAIELAHGPSRRKPMSERVASVLYWSLMLLGFAWIFSMAVDREPPVRQISREVVNPNGQVRVGERLLVKGNRVRTRQCELTRRWWIIDGAGRRLDFEPERFDAYGEVGNETEITGPFIPLDAMPGRGRLNGVLAYDCNPLQRALGWSIVVMLPPLNFEIVARAP